MLLKRYIAINFESCKTTVIWSFSLYCTDFCTEWPSALDSDEKCEQHFPIEIETVDYVSSGTSIRNPKARVVTLRVSSIFGKQLLFQKRKCLAFFSKYVQI